MAWIRSRDVYQASELPYGSPNLFAMYCPPPLLSLNSGVSGATIRLYIEQYTDDAAWLKEDAQVTLKGIIQEAPR
jgi:hypothetical protein